MLIALAYAYAWLPVSRERVVLSQSAPELRARLVQMRHEAGEVARLQAVVRPAASDLKSIVEQSAISGGLRKALAEIDADGPGRVRVRMQAVRSSDWFAWVTSLQSEHGIRVETLRLEALEGADMVAAIATFSGGR